MRSRMLIYVNSALSPYMVGKYDAVRCDGN